MQLAILNCVVTALFLNEGSRNPSTLTALLRLFPNLYMYIASPYESVLLSYVIYCILIVQDVRMLSLSLLYCSGPVNYRM